METSASGEVFQAQDVAEPVAPSVGPVEPVVVKPKSKQPLIFGIVSLVLIVALVAALVVTRNRPETTEADATSGEAVWTEYKNPNGFSFKYPNNLNFTSETGELVLPGDKKAAFTVKQSVGPLSATATQTGLVQSFYTVDSRTGFKLEDGPVTHYLFPLTGNNYLEVKIDESSELVEEIVTGIKFVAPEVQS